MKNEKKNDSKKTATNNQWVSTGQSRPNDKKERRDGPSGEGTE